MKMDQMFANLFNTVVEELVDIYMYEPNRANFEHYAAECIGIGRVAEALGRDDTAQCFYMMDADFLKSRVKEIIKERFYS